MLYLLPPWQRWRLNFARISAHKNPQSRALQPSKSDVLLHSCGADRPEPALHACGSEAHAAVPPPLQAGAGAQHAGPSHVPAGAAGPHG